MPESNILLDAIDQHPQSVYVTFDLKEVALPQHRHNKGQLVYVNGGIAFIHLPEKTLLIPARHYAWIPAGLYHYVEMRRPESTVSLFFYVDDDDQLPFFNKGGIYPINSMLMEMLFYSGQWKGDVFSHDKAFPFLAGIKNILPQISKNALPISLPTTTNERMLPVIDYINAHIFETITMEDLSKHLGFSERTLARLFHDTLKTSFHQYFKLLRMLKGIELMLQTDKSMSEIAYTLGYNNLSAFSNIFYQITGVRPREFLKRSTI